MRYSPRKKIFSKIFQNFCKFTGVWVPQLNFQMPPIVFLYKRVLLPCPCAEITFLSLLEIQIFDFERVKKRGSKIRLKNRFFRGFPGVFRYTVGTFFSQLFVLYRMASKKFRKNDFEKSRQIEFTGVWVPQKNFFRPPIIFSFECAQMPCP